MNKICKNCGNKKMKCVYSIKEIEIVECRRCGFIQAEVPEKVEKYDYTNTYFDNNKYRDNFCQRKENERRKRIVLKFCFSDSRVLDVGCASGEFVSYMSDKIDIYGVDFAPNAIELAKKKYPKIQDRFQVSSIVDIEEVSVPYDAVCMWDVIEHIDEPKRAIEHAAKMLKSGGYIFLSTPNIGSLFAKLTRTKWPFMTPPEHLSFFSRKSMNYLAQKMGLRIIKRGNKGKWVNFGFLLYKVNRVIPGFISERIIRKFESGILCKLNIYVPTHDIQYVVLKKE